jgi:hypothetical protein
MVHIGVGGAFTKSDAEVQRGNQPKDYTVSWHELCNSHFELIQQTIAWPSPKNSSELT